MTDAQCETLRELALRLPNEFVAIEPDALATQLLFMASMLPSQNLDLESGQMRFAGYTRYLGGYSEEAVEYLVDQACGKFDWFPTPHQCLDILASYRPPVTRKDKALRICAEHTQAKFEEWMDAVRRGADCFLGVPERWLRIATERGYLRCVDGEYVPRWTT